MTAETTPDAPEPTQGPQDRGDTDGPGREAAGYRVRLRETETERDELAGRVERMNRAEVERLAAGRLAVPGDVWTAGVELVDLLAEDGTLDPALVDGAIAGVLSEHPHWGPLPGPSFDLGVRTSIGPAGPSFHDVLRGRK